MATTKRNSLRTSFAVKLGIVITLLSVILTSGSVYYFYKTTYQTIIAQIGQNLLTLGRLGSTLFDDEARQAIKRLKLASERDSIVTVEQIEAIPRMTTLLSLSVEDIAKHQSSRDFQKLRNILVKIGLASIQDMEPPQNVYHLENPLEAFSNGGVGTYLFVPIKESPDYKVFKYLASSAPEPTPDGWPGNPIGNLYRGPYPFTPYIENKSKVDGKLFTDEYYTSLTATVAILDTDGSLLAVLGLDYAAEREQNILKRLSYLCFALILLSFFLSVFVSYYFSKRLSGPLRKLYHAAERVRERDFDVEVDIKSKDEFAVLGQSFNQMVSSTRSWTKVLKEKNAQLTTVIHDMHDGVGAILTSIVMASRPSVVKNDQLESINRLAQQGLSEVRFLMNSVDSYDFSFQTLLEEIDLLGQDIIQSAGLDFHLQVIGESLDRTLGFSSYLDLQRIVRESFVNTIKHAQATTCTVEWTYHKDTVNIQIEDNGVGEIDKMSKGRGIISIFSRVKKLGGECVLEKENGYKYVITVPYPHK